MARFEIQAVELCDFVPDRAAKIIIDTDCGELRIGYETFKLAKVEYAED